MKAPERSGTSRKASDPGSNFPEKTRLWRRFPCPFRRSTRPSTDSGTFRKRRRTLPRSWNITASISGRKGDPFFRAWTEREDPGSRSPFPGFRKEDCCPPWDAWTDCPSGNSNGMEDRSGL